MLSPSTRRASPSPASLLSSRIAIRVLYRPSRLDGFLIVRKSLSFLSRNVEKPRLLQCPLYVPSIRSSLPTLSVLSRSINQAISEGA